jgi:hypothetical protein
MQQQTQFNEKMGKYGKGELKHIVKYNLLLVGEFIRESKFGLWAS